MQTLEYTAPRGVKVLCNADKLSATLGGAADNLTMALTTGTMFANNDIVTVQDEDVKITAGGGGTSATIERAQNGTTRSSHISEALVYAEHGDTLITKTFTAGTEYYNAIRFGGEIEAIFGIYKDGVRIYTVYTTPYKLEELIPFYRYQPEADTVWTIEVWTTAAEAMFWAVYQ